MAMIFGVQMLFAVVVALTFGIFCPANVLTSDYGDAPIFPPESWLTQTVQVLFSCVLLLTYPGCIVIAREYCESLWVLYAKNRDGVDFDAEEEDEAPNDNADADNENAQDGEKPLGKYEVSRSVQIIIAGVLVALTAPFLLSPSAGDLADQVLDFVGNFACGFMAFVLPSLCYWSVYGFYPGPKEERALIDRVLPIVICVFGCFGCIAAFFDPIHKLTGWSLLGNSMPGAPSS